MKITVSGILPVLAFITLFSLSFCGNTSIKNSKKEIDSIQAEKIWDKTIPGNFSEQKIIKFDSLLIDSFLQEYPLFKSLDSNLRLFYQKREYNYAWFDQNGLIEQVAF